MKSRVYGAIDKFCCKQTATFFCCVLMKNVASGPLLLMWDYFNVTLFDATLFDVALFTVALFTVALLIVALF